MPDYSTPVWFKSGALPRQTAFGKLKGVPVFRDVIEIIPESEWLSLIPKQDGLRQCVPPCYGHESEQGIYDQDGVGSCASEAKDQSMSIIRVAKGLRWVEFNPWGTYYTVSGGVDRGSTLDDNIAFAMERGCFPESIWPRSKGWRAKPSDAAYEAAYDYRLLEVFDIETREEAGTALLKGWPVYYGSNGHAKVFVRLTEDGNTCIYANSWALTWGDGGFGMERLTSVNFGYGCFAVRSVVDTDEIPEPEEV